MTTFETRRIGIEEEFALLHSTTGAPVPGAADLLIAEEALCEEVEHEFLDSQVEVATPPCTTASEAEDSLFGFRERLSARARDRDLVLAPTGTPPVSTHGPTGHTVTQHERYQAIANGARQMARSHYINGQHVHVSIGSREEGVRAVNGLARWAPLLLAMTTNSPLWEGSDTGFHSWRHVIGSAWPLNSFPAHFSSPDEYDERVERLLRSGLLLDRGLVSWTARLSSRYPTVELRIADVQLTPTQSVNFALVVRALVDTVVRDAQDPGLEQRIDAAEVNISLWAAARDSLGRTLVDPAGCRAVLAGEWIDDLLVTIAPALARTSDTERVTNYLSALKLHGSPAGTQRRIFDEAGIPGLLNLYRMSHVKGEIR